MWPEGGTASMAGFSASDKLGVRDFITISIHSVEGHKLHDLPLRLRDRSGKPGSSVGLSVRW